MDAATADPAVYRAVADPHRRRMLDLLAARDRTVTELVGAFAMSQPAVSQHLGVLRAASLAVPVREGRFRRYQLNAAPLREIDDWLSHYERFWDDSFARLGGYLDGEHDDG